MSRFGKRFAVAVAASSPMMLDESGLWAYNAEQLSSVSNSDEQGKVTQMKRREFLRFAGSAAGAAALSQTSVFSLGYTNTLAPEKVVEGMPRRRLGKTEEYLSLVGFPGLSLVHDDLTQEHCTQSLHQAFEQGVNYFDVAPAYGNLRCETRMGIGLQGIDRSKIFLACKTKKRDAEGAQKELENSLKLLKTDYFDLYQMHHLCSIEEVHQALAPGGALEVMLKAKEQGKIKHLGFSAHTTKAALEVMNGFHFDTVMFPINFVELYTRDYGKAVLDLANEQGLSVISIKTMSWGAWPQGKERQRDWWYQSVEEKKDVDLAWRWTLSRRGVMAGIPPSFGDLVEKAILAAKEYRPPTEAELQMVEDMAAGRLSLFEEEEARFAQGTLPQGTLPSDERDAEARIHRHYYDYV